ncbi:MAG TPA: PaaI family thioesterase [Alcanivoracaceae bacterium]|nr:PaaI family thioesterase [Alcanivoracaceae bacterium]
MSHPFAELIGLEVDVMEAGQSACSITVTETLLNPHQVAHGAVLYALADTGMGAALYPMLGKNQLCATIDININYFAPVYEGLVRCETKIVNKGKRIVNLESELYSGGELVAKANGHFAIFEPQAHHSN